MRVKLVKLICGIPLSIQIGPNSSAHEISLKISSSKLKVRHFSCSESLPPEGSKKNNKLGRGGVQGQVEGSSL